VWRREDDKNDDGAFATFVISAVISAASATLRELLARHHLGPT